MSEDSVMTVSSPSLARVSKAVILGWSWVILSSSAVVLASSEVMLARQAARDPRR
jgi:hypothetical protein